MLFCSVSMRMLQVARAHWLAPVLLGLLLVLGAACSRESSPAGERAADPSAVATSSPSNSAEALPPAPEKVSCSELMEWIRFRPLTKACTRDADCVLQRDACCDTTAVHVAYSTVCQKTCKEECPQDSVIGQRLTQQAICKNGSCDLLSRPLPASP